MGGAGATFHTFDPEEGRLTCVPHTPCPVLAGLRGRDPAVLVERGLPALRSACEPFTSWLLWATNQGSGDHVTPVPSLAAARPSTTAQLRATVVGQPGRRAGGHLFVACADADGTRFEAAAFEPTKQFRDVVGRLRPGDEAELVGPVEGGVLRLEKLRVVSLAATRTKVANPACPSCGKAMKSAGAGAGYRCRGCGTSAGDEAATWLAEARTLSLGWHEVPVAARRHLHRPLAWEGRERGGEGGDGGGEGLSPPSAVASACASPSSR
jgi:tRNA(Ile2)-agmatinylcytidine synthase